MRPQRYPARFVIASALLAAGAVALAACDPDHYVIVTIDAPDAVHDATVVTVALTNAGTTRMDNLALHDHAFPVTFSISSPGRDGALTIAVDALDATGLVVGHGATTTTTAATAATIALTAMDFVVNTDYPGDQFPSDDFEANGFQLAALPDDTWTAAFRASCIADACSVFARRFDRTGRPIASAVAASSNAFPVTTTVTSPSATVAVAASQTTTLAVWDFHDVGTDVRGIACRALDAAGKASPAQTTVAVEDADVVSVAALPSGDFVASWTTLGDEPTQAIRAVMIQPDCTPLADIQSVSTAPGLPIRGAVAASAEGVLFTWLLDGELHARTATPDGLLVSDDIVVVPAVGGDQIVQARIAAVPAGGFAVALRWARFDADVGAGRIELRRLDATGQLLGAPTLITDKSDSADPNVDSFGLASRRDGTLLVAWHTCDPFGDTSGCGVFGRVMRDTGEPVTDVFVIPTTTDGDQIAPSVVGLRDAFVVMWRDASARLPDASGSSVRARLIYPP
jgi:hypothetical protein